LSLDFTSRVTVAPDVVHRTIGDETVLLNLKTEQYLGLGTRMWAALREATSIQEAFDKLLNEYEVEAERLRDDVHEFVRQLREQGLIELVATGAP
jgi:GH35 family endo-1,4-beta-xylanase